MVNVVRCAVLALLTVSVAMGQDRDQLDAGVNALVAEQPQHGNAAAQLIEPVKLEFRLAETEPGEGTTRVSVGEEGEVIYLRPEVVATADHILEAKETGDPSTGVRLTFTTVGAARMKQATEQNLQKRMALLINGEVMSAPVIMDAVGREMQITALDVEMVHQVVEGIRSRLLEWELRIGVPWAVDGFIKVNDPKRDEPVWVSKDGILTIRDVVRTIRADRESLTLQLTDDTWERIRAATPNAGRSFIAELVINGEHALTLDAGVVTGSGGFDGLPSGSFLGLRSEDPNDVREVAAAVAPPQYQAFLLLLKAQWGEITSVTSYQADLLSALRKVQISQELRDRLPHSGPEIFFNSKNVGYFAPEHFSETLAWLSRHDLVKGPLVSLMDVGVAENSATIAASVLMGDEHIFDSLGTKRPFARQVFEFDWKAQTARGRDHLDRVGVTRSLMREEVTRGAAQPARRKVDTCNIVFRVHHDHIAVFNVFSHAKSRYRQTAAGADLIPLLMLVPRSATIRQDAVPRLHVPDIVEEADSTYRVDEDPKFPGLRSETQVSNVSKKIVADVLHPDLSGDIALLRKQSGEADSTAKELAQEFLSQRLREKGPTKTELAEIRKKLEEAVRRAYELRQQLHLAEIKRMQEKLTQAEMTVKQRRDQQEQIIRRRVDELLNPTLTWDSF